jgi:hypothetical protein
VDHTLGDPRGVGGSRDRGFVICVAPVISQQPSEGPTILGGGLHFPPIPLCPPLYDWRCQSGWRTPDGGGKFSVCMSNGNSPQTVSENSPPPPPRLVAVPGAPGGGWGGCCLDPCGAGICMAPLCQPLWLSSSFLWQILRAMCHRTGFATSFHIFLCRERPICTSLGQLGPMGQPRFHRVGLGVSLRLLELNFRTDFVDCSKVLGYGVGFSPTQITAGAVRFCRLLDTD